jgi:hypothetical protein
MATTTNYGWTTPDDTALVKDGASAIRTLGSSVDTTTKALNPSTTLGDIEYRSSTANTNTRLPIGTSGQYLTVSGGVPAWGDVSAGGMTLISTTTFSGATTTLSSIPQTYNSLFLIISGVSYASGSNNFRLFPNNVNNLCDYRGVRSSSATSATNTLISLSAADNMSQSNTDNLWTIQFNNYTSTTSYKSFTYTSNFLNNSSVRTGESMGGVFRSNTALTSLVFDVEGTIAFSTGTVLLYGVK